MFPNISMDLEAIASQKADAWQKSADEAAARMRKRDGFCIVQLTAADAATVQVGSPQIAGLPACHCMHRVHGR